MATIFRPDAHPEVSSVDGYVNTFAPTGGVDWAVIRAGISERFASNDTAVFAGVVIKSEEATDKWENLYRSVLSFDTSTIPDDATIISATLSLHGGAGKDDELNINPSINLYAVSLTDDTDIGLDQPGLETMWDSFGSTAYCDTAIAFASWSDIGWNTFILNDIGLAAISKTGNTRIGLREVKYDVSGTPPAWSHVGSDDTSRIYWWTADWLDGSLAPKLTITTSTIPTVTTQAVTHITSLNAIGHGNLTDTGGAAVTKLGICWNLAGTPTVADSTQESSSSEFSTGAFWEQIVDLIPETLYYVRAYAYNIYGYGYGDEVTFTSSPDERGFVWTEDVKFHIIDETGIEQNFENFDQDLNTTNSVQFSELLLTPKSSSTGAEGTIYYDLGDNHVHGKVA